MSSSDDELEWFNTTKKVVSVLIATSLDAKFGPPAGTLASHVVNAAADMLMEAYMSTDSSKKKEFGDTFRKSFQDAKAAAEQVRNAVNTSTVLGILVGIVGFALAATAPDTTEAVKGAKDDLKTTSVGLMKTAAMQASSPEAEAAKAKAIYAICANVERKARLVMTACGDKAEALVLAFSSVFGALKTIASYLGRSSEDAAEACENFAESGVRAGVQTEEDFVADCERAREGAMKHHTAEEIKESLDQDKAHRRARMSSTVTAKDIKKVVVGE
jgi:hypothetical protein